MGVRHFSASDRLAIDGSWRRGAGLVVFIFGLLAGRFGRFFLGGTQPDAGSLAGAVVVLSGGDGRRILCARRGGAAAGQSESGPAVARLGSGVVGRNAVRDLGTVVATMA